MSALMWVLYFYLIRTAFVDLYDVVTESFAWAFAGAASPSVPALSRLVGTLEEYGVVILANGAILIVWALYNQLRFSRSSYRRFHEPVSVADLAALYQLPAEDIANWQQSRILLMEHDPDGTLVQVMSREPAEQPSMPLQMPTPQWSRAAD
jgi:biofilm PGA synthesis protein PgaD